jgi:hypothetical protein
LGVSEVAVWLRKVVVGSDFRFCGSRPGTRDVKVDPWSSILSHDNLVRCSLNQFVRFANFQFPGLHAWTTPIATKRDIHLELWRLY